MRRIRRIESELAELLEMRGGSAINNDGMPHASSGNNDLSGYAAELDELECSLRKERLERVLIYKDIAKRIKCIRSENEKDVLFYRYIRGMEWWEIAEKMNYSERQVHRYHGQALGHISIADEKMS